MNTSSSTHTEHVAYQRGVIHGLFGAFSIVTAFLILLAIAVSRGWVYPL